MINRPLGPRIAYAPENGAGAGTGNPGDGANGAGLGNGSSSNNGAGTSPWTGLALPENQELVKTKNWANPDAALRSYAELERKMGGAIFLPEPTADPTAWDGIFDRMGRPKSAAEYKLERPKDLPETAYDADTAEQMKGVFHKAGLTPRQAAIIHDEVFTGSHKAKEALQAANAEKVAKAHEQIVKEYGGDENSEAYKRNLELANRAVRQFGGDALLSELKEIGAMDPNGYVKAPLVAKMLAQVGKQLFQEDAVYGGAGDYKNPFADATMDMEKQGEIIKKDPDRARALIRAAGHNPAEWQL
jgi:hypothetical protein